MCVVNTAAGARSDAVHEAPSLPAAWYLLGGEVCLGAASLGMAIAFAASLPNIAWLFSPFVFAGAVALLGPARPLLTPTGHTEAARRLGATNFVCTATAIVAVGGFTALVLSAMLR